MESIPFDADATGMVDLHAAASTKVGGGRYSLRRILGRGGMGIVWLAYDERLQCEVALKFLPAQIRFDPVAVDDLRRETARSQKLSHPNIIRIHDLYEIEGQDAFISMEYVDGQNLGALRVQQAERVLRWQFLEPLMPQLCDALEYAHSQGIIHRDLKPANLIVDQAGKLKLADFGIARAATDTMSRSSVGQTSGTLLYMSPQQLDGGSPKVTDDIYGIGATLYELVTSKPPFYSGDLTNQVRNVLARPLQERLQELKLTNDVPRHVEEIILACLDKVDSKRPQAAREVAEWLASGKRPGSKKRRGIVIGPYGAIGEKNLWLWATTAAAVITLVTAWILIKPTYKKVVARSVSQPVATPVAERQALAPASLKGVSSKPVHTTEPATFKASESPAPAGTVQAPVANPPISKVDAVRQSQKNTNQITGSDFSDSKSSPIAPSGALAGPASVSPGVSATAKQPSALQLLRQGNTHVSERSRNKVVQILSSRTPVDVPPQQWRIIYYDPKVRSKSVEVQFENGEMTRVYEPTRFLGILTPQSQETLDAEQLKIDSTDALRIALSIPASQALSVRSVEFELERGYGGSPVWKIQLFGSASNDSSRETGLGYVIILADDGRVLKETLSKKQQRAP